MRPWVTVISIAGPITLFRLWATSRIGLLPDEAYYWLWARAPATGYYDHPPMIAWWIWLCTKVLGDSALGIRALPVLSLFVTSIAVCGTVLELYSDRKLAVLATLWLNAMILVGLGAIFATPDPPSIMFWGLTVWALARLRRTENPSLWIIIGLFAGLGCVSKYTNLFLGPGILLWLAIDPKARRWRSSPWLLAGGFVALAVFMPVILWNAEHHWVSFAKQFGRIGDGHPALGYSVDLLLVQFALINPIIAIFAAIAIGRFWRDRKAADVVPLTFLLALTSPLLLYLLFHSIHNRVQGNWPGPAYPALAIVAAVAAAETRNSRHLRRLAGLAAPVGIGLVALVLGYFATPYASGFPFESPADRLLGWTELSAAVEAYRQQAGANWIATTDYGVTGELAFHAQNPELVQEIIDRERYSFDAPEASLVATPALLVVHASDRRLEQFEHCFQSISPMATVTRNAGARIIERYAVLKVSGAPADLLSRGCQG
jgi:4-amino-4-deoxy-L-arabinose transferase-like glycosyltransferase